MSFTNTYLAQVPPHDQREVLKILASNTSGSEVAFYFAAQRFFASPSVDKAFGIYEVLIRRQPRQVSNRLSPVNMSTTVANNVGISISTWGAHVRSRSHGGPALLTNSALMHLKDHIFDATWSSINGHNSTWHLTMQVTANAGDPPDLANMTRGNYPNYEKLMVLGLASLKACGIVI